MFGHGETFTRRQMEIVNKDTITKEDMDRAKVLVDILGTIATINDYYNGAPRMHKTPIQADYDVDRFGIGPGTKIYKLTDSRSNPISGNGVREGNGQHKQQNA